MTKLWRVPGVNMELHTAETCDRPGAYLVAHLPETERPLTIRALKMVAREHERWIKYEGVPPEEAALSACRVWAVLERMPPGDRFIRPPELTIAPPSDAEIAVIHTHFRWANIGDGKGLLRDMLTMFVDMRNRA